MCERTGGWRASWKPVQSSPSCCACPSAFFLLQAKSTSFRATSVTVENMEKNDTEEKNIIPDYVCCVLSEGTWTWFGAILVSLLLLLIAILKYCRKYLSKPKFESKNLTLLRKSLIGNWQLYFTLWQFCTQENWSFSGWWRCFGKNKADTCQSWRIRQVL